MDYSFNTDYVLWHDERRTYLIQRYENNDSHRGWISVIHPAQAAMTGENNFAEARDFWKEETLFKAIAGQDYADYLSAESQLPVNNRGILGGIAGIGLTLLSIETDNLLLDDFFLLT